MAKSGRTFVAVGVLMLASLPVGTHAQAVPDPAPTPASAAGASPVAGTNTVPAAASGAAPAPARTTQDVPGLRRREDDILTLQSTSRLVVVDVVVTDANGHAVRGLKATDFTLKEDGIPQVISQFDEHTQMTPQAAAAEAARTKLPPNTFSNYGPAKEDSGYIVFLIDALDNEVQDQMRLRQQMMAYMKTAPAGTRLAIFELDTQMHMLQGFTSDPGVLLAAIQSKRDSPKFSPMLVSPGSGGVGAGLSDALPGERGNAENRNLLKRMRSRVLAQGMMALGKYLSGFPGRKSLVWFTGDIPVAGTTGGPGFNDQFLDQTSFTDELDKTTEVLRVNQIAVYPIDARGLTATAGAGQMLQQGALADVAAATGGRAFYNTNGIVQAMAEVVDETSNFYTLSFNPTNRKFDGQYRKLSVELSQEKLQLSYRPGYFARSDDAELAAHRAARKSNRGPLTVSAVGAAPVTSIDTAMPLGAPAKRDVLFFAQVKAPQQAAKPNGPLAKDNFLAAKYRKGAYREYQVHFAAKAASLNLPIGADGHARGQVDFVTVVYDDQGQEVNSKISRAKVDADPRIYPLIARDGVEVVQTIAVPAKGSFFLRLGVHDVTTDKSGSIEVPVGEVKVGTLVAGAGGKP